MSVKCPPGYIVRDGYHRRGYLNKNGTYVKPTTVPATCIKDLGGKGRGKDVFAKLKSGDLTKYGYHLKESDTARRRLSLLKSAREFKPLTVFKKVQALSILHKNTNPVYAKRAKSDAEWISRNYLGK